MNGFNSTPISGTLASHPANASMSSEIELFRVRKIIDEALLTLKKLTRQQWSGSTTKDVRTVISMLEECRKQNVAENTQYLNDEILERDFYKRLLCDFPSLTICERRLCLLTLLHLSTKDISDVTRQSVDAVNKSRLRLRKKMGLTGTKTTLLQFLDRYRS